MAGKAGAIRAGRAFVELFVHDSPLAKGLDSAGRKLRGFGSKVAAIGAGVTGAGVAIAGPLISAAKLFARTGDELDEMSERTGASVEFLAKLGYAAEMGGTVPMEAMETSLRFMQRAAYGASTGVKSQQRAFDALGVSVTDAGERLTALGAQEVGAVPDVGDAAEAYDALGEAVAGVGEKLTALGAQEVGAVPDVGDAVLRAPKVGAVPDVGDAALRAPKVGAVPDVGDAALRAPKVGAVPDVGDAAEGLKKQQGAYDALGISVTDAGGKLKPVEDLFMETALALSQVENSTEKAALATAIFGRAGTKLLPVLAGGEEGLFAFFEEAERLGVVMSKEDVESATLFGDAMTRLKLTLKGVAVKVGGAVAPILTELGNKLAEIAGKVSKFVQANKPLILTVFKVGVALAAAGVAITAIGLGIVFLGATLSGLAVIAGAVVVAFKATVAAIVLAFKAILAAIVFLISPIGLVIAAVVALGAYLLYASGAGQRGLDSLRAAFASIKETAIAAFGGIKDALSAGDWKLAVEILWAAIKLEWEKGTGWLYDHWLGFKDRVLMIWEDLTGKLRDTFSGFINTFGEGIGWLYDRWLVFKDGVLTIWEDLTGNLREIFSGFIDTSSEDWGGWMAWFGEAWTGVQKRIAKGFAWIIGTVKGLDTAAMMEDIDRQYKHRLDEQRNTRKLVAEEDKRAREARAEARKRDTKARQTELKRELDAAIALARKAAEAKAPGKAPGVKDEDDRAARLARIRASIRASIPSATLEPPLGSIAGTFSAAVAMRLGDERTVQERIAEAAEEAVEGIDHLIDVAEGLGLEW